MMLSQLLMSRREFVLSASALALLESSSAADAPDLFAACESVLKTVSARVLDDLWDKQGQETPTDPDDAKDLEKVFGLFVKDAASKSEFLFTKKFVCQPANSNGVEFILPHADSNGVPLDALLRNRIAAQSVPKLKTRCGEIRTDYVQPVPDIVFPTPATTLNISFQYLGTEDLTATTLPTEVENNSGAIGIKISSGFVRRLMQSCIYAFPVVRDSRTLLWSTLRLLEGSGDSILVEAADGPTSISLLPLFCVVDTHPYKFIADQKQVVVVTESFHRVFDAFIDLKKGKKLGPEVDIARLRNDIEHLAGISQMFFLTTNYIVCHEVAHAVYLHTVTSDTKKNHHQEMIADQAATTHMFITALTDSLDVSRSWTKYWKYSLVGSKPFEQSLLWYERLFGFGIATNIALDVLGSHGNSTHPENESRWSRNVRVWNNWALALSNITIAKR
jgi:hypothetical protein